MTDLQAADEQASAVADVVGGVLGATVMGVYLYGSATAGGLKPDSDLDVLGVTRRPTLEAERLALVRGLVPISWRNLRPASWRPVELTLVVQSDVRPWRFPSRFDFQYGEWLREELVAGNLHPWPETNPDVAVLLTMVLSAGRPLFGPAAAERLDPVPAEDLVRASVADGAALVEDLPGDTRNVLLTLARMWSTLETGKLRSKDQAADWAVVAS